MQARYYDPVIGRFYSNDPVGYTSSNPVMSFNRYLYANNNPYKYVDPDGEFAVLNPHNKKVVQGTMDKLNELDKKTPGVDYTITSGQRTAEENKKVGGAAKSPHVIENGGTGVDVNPSITSSAPNGSEINTDTIAEVAAEVGFTGIITYTKEDGTSNNSDSNGGRLHLDSRDGKFHARQKKNSKGKKYYEKRDYDN